jgi:hypothetical protein
MLVHLVARTFGRKPAFVSFEGAKWMWDTLRRAFGGALAALLMPAHLHLIAEIVSATAARLSFARILGSFARFHSPSDEDPIRWQPVPRPQAIEGPEHLRRQLRYVALNPCRDKLVRDPLEWLWSTHRDVVGAVANPWVASSRLARLLDENGRGFADSFHRYVSGDKSCDVRGTLPPRAPRPAECARFPLERITTAAAAATRQPLAAARVSGPTRTAFVLLAQRQGWTDARVLARACGMTTRGIRDLRTRECPELLAAATLCLGDDRLLAPWLAVSRRA